VVIGIVGSRRRNAKQDRKAVRLAYESLVEQSGKPVDQITLCSGLCPQGGDEFARQFAEANGHPTLWFPAEWDKHGRAAGFIRNTDIAENSEWLIACVSPDRKGGTEDTVTKFIKAHGIDRLIIVGVPGPKPVLVHKDSSRFTSAKRSERVYIGRPSKWGNPFDHRIEGKKVAIAKHRAWIMTEYKMLASLRTLWGKTLGCFCPPNACHGDTLVELSQRI